MSRQRALAVFQELRLPYDIALANRLRAAVLMQQGQPDEAKTLLQQAAGAFQELKLEHEVKKTEELLANMQAEG